MSIQKAFNPAAYTFAWTDDGWYTWNRKEAHRLALKARNAEAKRLTESGKRVIKSTSAGQQITRGGIGSGKPEISMIVSVYTLDAY